MMKQEPISCRADNTLAARCHSCAACWARVFKRPSSYLPAYINNNEYLYILFKLLRRVACYLLHLRISVHEDPLNFSTSEVFVRLSFMVCC